MILTVVVHALLALPLSLCAQRQQQDEPAVLEKKPEQEATLDTVVVTAERGVPIAYPGGRDVIEPETKETYPDQAISSVLRRVPGVYFLPENGNDSRFTVGLRGNDPRRSGLTAVLVDGIPVCEAPYGNTDLDGLPITFERIWRTDVIRGGASIRYGPNSAGGVINFLTEPVPETPFVRFGSRYGSDNDWSESLATGGTYGDFGYLLSGVVKGGDGFRDNSEYKDEDGALKLRYAVSDTGTLTAYASRFLEPHAEQPGGLTQAAYDANPDQSLRDGSYFSFDTNRYVLAYTEQVGEDSSLQLKAWYQGGHRLLYDYRPIVQPFTQYRVQDSTFDSSALEGSYNWRGRIFGLEHRFFHSLRFLSETNDEFYYRGPVGGGPIETPYELHALFEGRAFSSFNEDVIALSEKLDLALGFRYESLDMFGRSRDDGSQIFQTYTELLPETSLTYRLDPDTALYASYQRSFFPPQYETGFDPASVLYAPTKPEHSDAFEAGVRTRAFEGLECSLAAFDTEFHDKIDFINTPEGKIPINTGLARAIGAEFGANYDCGAAARSLDGLALYGSLTAQRSRIETGDNQGNDTPNSPHLLASWGAQYDHEPTGLWTRIGGSYSASSYKDPENTPVGTADGINGPEPSYTLWDCAVGWNQHPDRSGFALSVGITNLFDHDYYRRFVSGIYPGAPRQAFAALSYTIGF
ncbi:MAG: TonB-dependent receptor [Planctomycetes bacterium]|nr:TonB-dependent receptor [Planctomycetota bacterium]